MPDRAMATLERVARENGKPMPLGKLVDVVAEVYLRTCHTPRPADLSSVLGGNALSCCDLFFSHLRSEGWPYHGRTFSIYP